MGDDPAKVLDRARVREYNDVRVILSGQFLHGSVESAHADRLLTARVRDDFREGLDSAWLGIGEFTEGRQCAP